MRSSLRLLCLVSLIVAVAGGAEAAKKKKKKTEPQDKPAATVERWLVLGPAVDPLPVFHDEKKGGFDLKARLEAEVFPRAPWVPESGEVEDWFAGERLAWTAISANDDGLVELETPEGAGEGRPASAWLATYVSADRFRSVKLEILGAHPRRAWIDLDSIGSGGLGKEPGKVEGTAKLVRGKHLLLVETLWDPSKEEGWTIGAAFSPASGGAEEEKGDGDKEDDGGDKKRKPNAGRGTGADAGGTVAGQGPGVAFSLDPERGVTILDILDPPSVGSLDVSPDGRYLAASVSRYLPGTDERESWIEVRAAEDGRLERTWRGGFGMSQVAWAPAGLRLTYVTRAKGGDGKDSKSTLWIADLEANTVRPLLEGVAEFSGYRWSPDGRAIAYVTQVKPEPDERGIKRLEGLRDRWSYFRNKSHLNLVTVPGGARRRLTAGSLSTGGVAFSPDGRRLLFTRQVDDYERRPFTRTELWEIDLQRFEAKTLRESRWLGSASYSPDGKRLLIEAGAEEFGDAGRNVPEGMFSNSYDGQLFIWDPATDAVEAITREFDPSVSTAVWSRVDGQIYLTAEDRDYDRLYRYDVKGKTFTSLDTGFDSFGRLALAEKAPVAAGTATSPWTPQGLVVVDLARDTSKVVYRPADAWFSNVRVGTVEPWSFTASSGKTIDGRVYLPPDFDPSRKYPCIVYYYGGTSPTSRDFGGRYPKEYWAAQGYVVYTLQPSGATGFGQAFSAIHVNDWGKTTSEEIIEGTRKFLTAHPFVDPERVGCIGASYGGFMTMLLSTRTDLFSAAVSHAGISSIASYWGEGYWGYLYSSIATADSYPWNRRDVYVEQSPLFRADQNRVPILLTHGVDDTNVPVGESDQFYIALKLLGKEVEYLQVAGQDHWILEHPKRIVWSRSIVAWFDKWLKDQPEWWEALYPEAE